MASSVDQLANRLVNGGRAITRANRVGVEQACLAAKEVLIVSAVSSGMPPPGSLLRGVGTKGAKWTARYDVKGYQNPVGQVYYRGPVHLMNSGTRAHVIDNRAKNGGAGDGMNAKTWRMSGGRKSSSGKKALAFPDGGVRRGPVQHPGTKGMRFFEKAGPIIMRQSPRIIEQSVRGHLGRVFTGT